MSCEQYTDSFDLYAIGSLEKADAESLRSHLEGGCRNCGPLLDQALLQATLISGAVPLVEPPSSLRDRIAASVRSAPSVVVIPQKKKPAPSIAPWLLAAAAVTALVAGMGYEENARRSAVAALSDSMTESATANAQRTAAMLSILQAPGTRQVAFDINKANLPHGSLFIHKQFGVAMVVAQLPSAPVGFKYESWIVPKSGAPRPVESFETDKSGFAFTIVKGPVDINEWAAMAVSVEPANSTPTKPTKVVFASPV